MRLLKNIFFYTKGERRGFFLLILLVMFVSITKWLVINRPADYKFNDELLISEIERYEKLITSSQTKSRNSEIVKEANRSKYFQKNYHDFKSGNNYDIPLKEEVKRNTDFKDYIVQSNTSEDNLHNPGKEGTHEEIYPMNLNSVDSVSLKLLPGIGTVLSQRIVKYRDALGGFVDKKQLLEVYNLDTMVYRQIENLLIIDTNSIKKIDLSEVDYLSLVRHPYISPYMARAILSYRKLKPSFREVEELLDNNILQEVDYSKICKYLNINN